MSTSRYDFHSPAISPIDSSITRLLYASITKYSPEWNSTLHTHPCTELFYITGGNGCLHLNGKNVPISVDDMIVVNPGVEHTEISSEKNTLEYIVLGVEGLEALSGEDEEDGYSIVHFHSDRETLLFFLRSLLREIEAKQPGYQTICQNLLNVILIFLVRRSKFTLSFVPSARKSSQEAAVARRYIDNHFKENLTLDDLAALVHVSKYYLAHTFRREYGTSPINYLLSRRIQESLYLLSDTGMTLAEIAGTLGFSSPSYFSQSFRRIQGISPLQYRMQHRTNSQTPTKPLPK